MAVKNVKAGPLTWGSLSSRLYREPMDNSVLNYSYTDLLWELNQVDNTYNPGHGTGGMNNYYVGMITSVPYVNRENGKDKNESKNLRGPWYITYCATDDNEGTGRYAFTGHIEDTAIALNTYYADRIVLRQELDYAMQSGSVAPWQLGTYYTGVGIWYDAYMEAKSILASGKDLPDDTYFHTTTYSEIFNDYVNNVAIGDYSHAEGYNAYALASYSHVEGNTNTAYESAIGSHIEGQYNNSHSKYSHVEGTYNTLEENATYAHVEGIRNHAYTSGSHAEGYNTKSIGTYTHSENAFTEAIGAFSHAEGWASKSGGDSSHAEGFSNISYGFASHSEGVNTKAIGNFSHAEGMGGSIVTELADGNIAFSYEDLLANKAEGIASHVEGHINLAYGDYSHTQGTYSTTYGEASFSSGYGVQAYSTAETAIGKWNKSSKDDKNIFTIGDGSDNDNRHNVMSVYSSVINGQYKSIVNIDGYDTCINNSNSTNITSPVTYINSKTATYITYGDNNTIASYVDENGVTYAIDTYSGDLSYVVTYKQFAAAYSSIYHSIDGAISNLPPSVKSIDKFTRAAYTNTLNYTTQSIDPDDSKKWIDTTYTVTIESADETNAGLLSAKDKKYLNEIVNGDKVLVDKVTITTNKVDLYTYDSSTYEYKYIKTSTNLSFEDGYYIKWTGTWSWTHEDGKKDPESCESTQWSNTLPASGVQSETYTSDYINSTKEIARVVIKAKKRGLVVSNGQVKLASVSGLADDSYPKSISCNRFFYMYYGASTTQNVTPDMISSFSVKTGTAKSNYQSLDVKTNSSQCFVLIYPKSFDPISTIKRDGVEVITNSFVLMDENGITITNADGISHVYYVYATGIGTQSFSITVS